MALKTMGHVQQLDLDSCDWRAYDGLEDVLEELVHSLLLPYMADLGISMTDVFQTGLPVLMELMLNSMQPGKCLRDLLVAFMDRLACEQDLGIIAGTTLGSVLMHKLDNLAYSMTSDHSGGLVVPMPLCFVFRIILLQADCTSCHETLWHTKLIADESFTLHVLPIA